jgi:hypothetical protein
VIIAEAIDTLARSICKVGDMVSWELALTRLMSRRALRKKKKSVSMHQKSDAGGSGENQSGDEDMEGDKEEDN